MATEDSSNNNHHEGDEGQAFTTTQPSLAEVIGIPSGNNYQQGDAVLGAVYAGSEEFGEWAVRGNRTRPQVLAMTDIFVENSALTSATFRVRADHLAKVLSGSSYRALFAPQKKKLSTADLFFLGTFGSIVFGVVMLIGIMYA